MFEAEDQRLCESLKYQRCNGHGCVFESFKADDESHVVSAIIDYREEYHRIRGKAKKNRSMTRIIEENLAKFFINEHLKRQLVTIL